ncbi:putative U1 snRNP-associated protein Usp106 [Toxoplasma gondii TgCatPRC2]|uniref:U1 snRNP-associated protein Usp106, putative n=12 Tax=Toxoplasma gondii TaxID=5811 RepID=A0A125YN00_TOXGM|nr:U1 snRNP-associated protein Usp106, putative [Toxoplasma gondii ME49]EPR62647.1 putative U1 snRNP-associated protein Usp106 [Toxoplasma gondii GT1]ESS31925.1 putative U1 snRNP-associated protein Usp106 [Toxoplasma gondii VEG]KAF4640999.1 putative U1 snRNP-associated protein Usp106 [Toxoplasma gondii]KFG35068.1 putative U1 snRNP-associated protein Usp106 [Toxoplasma gondii p89]KFG49662.1 putative U1 snRNP-associated protein Usp106 [Toxoplasma gondii GAB2-2007-GAL-DOM2]KFG65531.1 putative U1|eukprot:XP_002365396.1 U1 snRNP-associated protein Usp106, putative [Toxoplasma gondii ME49]
MEEMRAQLAALMESIKAQPTDFTDPEVCKYFLTGLCPHDLFENTESGLYIKGYRFSLGPCKKTHSEELRARYMEARKTRRYGYEELSIQIVKQLIEEAERKVEKGQMRSDEGHIAPPEHVRQRLMAEVKALDDDIDEKLRKVDVLTEQGDHDAAANLGEVVASLQVKRCKLLFKGAEGTPQKLRPCDVCGALLSVFDTDKRLDEHFQGRIHVGFQKLRNILKKHLEYIASAPLPDASLRPQTMPSGTLSVNAMMAVNQIITPPPQRVDPAAIAAIARAQVQLPPPPPQPPAPAVNTVAVSAPPAVPASTNEERGRSRSRSADDKKSRSRSRDHDRKKKSRKRSHSRRRSKSRDRKRSSSKHKKHHSDKERSRDRDRRKDDHKEKHRHKGSKSRK